MFFYKLRNRDGEHASVAILKQNSTYREKDGLGNGEWGFFEALALGALPDQMSHSSPHTRPSHHQTPRASRCSLWD